MPFTVIYDACVLYPQYQRDLLIRIAITGIVRARWSDRILDEAFRSLRRSKPELNERKLTRTRELICKAVDDCLVKDYEPLIPALTLPDENDRHVLAAALKCGAQEIITNNLKDFPASELSKYGIQAISADSFIHHQIDLKPGVVTRIVTEMLVVYKNPPMSLHDLLSVLRKSALPRNSAGECNDRMIPRE